MSREIIEGKEVGKRIGFLRPLVEKIRNINVKWFLAGTAITVPALGIVLGTYLQNPLLSYAGLGLCVISTALLFFATDALDMAPRH